MTTIVIAIARPKFPLGQIVITANAQATLDPADVQQGLSPPRRRRLGRAVPRGRRSNDDGPEARRPAVFGLRPGRQAVLDHHRSRTARSPPCCCRRIINPTGRASARPSFHGGFMTRQSRLRQLRNQRLPPLQRRREGRPAVCRAVRRRRRPILDALRPYRRPGRRGHRRFPQPRSRRAGVFPHHRRAVSPARTRHARGCG